MVELSYQGCQPDTDTKKDLLGDVEIPKVGGSRDAELSPPNYVNYEIYVLCAFERLGIVDGLDGMGRNADIKEGVLVK
nr:hypothetical protein [Tanacetum cinerariifolium]